MMTSTLLDGACCLIFPLLPLHFYPDNEALQAELKIKPKQKQNILLISQREEVEKRMYYLWDFYGPTRAGTLLVGFSKDWKEKNSACDWEAGRFPGTIQAASSDISNKSVRSNKRLVNSAQQCPEIWPVCLPTFKPHSV